MNILRMINSAFRNYVIDGLRGIANFAESSVGVIRAATLQSEINQLRINSFNISDELIVLGNGPSLKQTLSGNARFFCGKNILCVNEFAHSEYYDIIKPNYYVLYDPAYWRKNPSEKIRNDISKSFNTMKDKTNWKMTLLMLERSRTWNYFQDLPRMNNNISIAYFHNHRVNSSRDIRYYFYKRNKAMPLAYNTLVAGIFLGLNLGFKKIYIVGADHSWHEDICILENNVLHWKNPHFFDKEETVLRPMYVDSFEKETFKMHEILYSLSLMFKGYIELEDYANYLGAKIYNATPKSYIDAFERYDINITP